MPGNNVYEGYKMLFVALLFLPLAGCRGSITPATGDSTGRPVPARSYASKFPLSENPIVEAGNWINGKAAGAVWADVATIPGLVYGAQSGDGRYDDSTALLAGTWGPDQTVEATVFSANQNNNVFEEVELRLRSSLSAHRSTGYEINFRCLKTAGAYTQIVRWNGPLGSFTFLSKRDGARYGVASGDLVKAAITGNVITVYINGVQVNQATDDTFTSGNPGLGFYLEGATGMNRDYGFTSLTASAGPSR